MIPLIWITLLGMGLASMFLNEPASAVHIYTAASLIVVAIWDKK